MIANNCDNICPLCGRLRPKGLGTEHHLIPKLKGGKNLEKELMHKICHSKIHSIFTEGELAKTYNTVDMLLTHEDIIKFVKWIQNKPDDFDDSNKQHKRKR